MQYLNVVVKLLMHMLMKDGLDSHRTSALNEEMMNNSTFQGKFLLPLVEKGCMESLWTILDKANFNQIKEFMSSRKADYIRSLLEQRDDNSLNKFLAYGGSMEKNLDQDSVSADLAEVKLSKQSYVGLGDH